MNLTIRLRLVSDGIHGAAREISVPIFELHPKIGAEIDREAPQLSATWPEAVDGITIISPAAGSDMCRALTSERAST
jgi:hypothetical protein